MKKLLTNIAFLRWFFVSGAVGFLVSVAFLIKHLTLSHFESFFGFLLSAKVALPPLALLAANISIALITGISIKNINKLIWRFIKYQFITSVRYLWFGISGTYAVAIAILIFISFHTPPHYDLFIREFLGGESDDYQVVDENIRSIEKINAELARQFQIAKAVFVERQKINFGAIDAKDSNARVYVRALEANVSAGRWENDPLRWHALAEAYGLYAQSIAAIDPRSTRINEYRKKSESLHLAVEGSWSKYATPLLRASAANNRGNLNYYFGDLGEALTAWRAANQPKNTATWGNIIAVLVLLGRIDEAISEGNEAKQWAEESGKSVLEPSTYSGILSNLGFAYWLNDSPADAEAVLRDAYAIFRDDVNLFNYAYALIVNSKKEEANKILIREMIDVDARSQASMLQNIKKDKCSYLLVALTEPRLARSKQNALLFTFLGESRSEGYLKSFTNRIDLLNRIWGRLTNGHTKCAEFVNIPGFKDQVFAL